MFSSEEPQPFEVINTEGIAPILVTCDHAENRIPKSLNGLSVDASILERHVAYDIGAKQVATALSERFDAPLLMSNYSRLVIDLNRHLDDPTLIPNVSDREMIQGNLNLMEDQRQDRIDQIFWPYHHAHKKLVDRLLERHEKPIILSVHSFTPIMGGVERPWHYGVLWDKCETLSTRLVGEFKKNKDLCVGENQPYNARDPLGYSMVVHAQDRGIDMGLLEIRQDLISHISGQKRAADVIARAVSTIIDRC